MSKGNKEVRWFYKNVKNLKEVYGNQWIAIANEQVVASSDDLEEIKEELMTNGINGALVTKAALPGFDITSML